MHFDAVRRDISIYEMERKSVASAEPLGFVFPPNELNGRVHDQAMNTWQHASVGGYASQNAMVDDGEFEVLEEGTVLNYPTISSFSSYSSSSSMPSSSSMSFSSSMPSYSSSASFGASSSSSSISYPASATASVPMEDKGFDLTARILSESLPSKEQVQFVVQLFELFKPYKPEWEYLNTNLQVIERVKGYIKLSTDQRMYEPIEVSVAASILQAQKLFDQHYIGMVHKKAVNITAGSYHPIQANSPFPPIPGLQVQSDRINCFHKCLALILKNIGILKKPISSSDAKKKNHFQIPSKIKELLAKILLLCFPEVVMTVNAQDSVAAASAVRYIFDQLKIDPETDHPPEVMLLQTCVQLMNKHAPSRKELFEQYRSGFNGKNCDSIRSVYIKSLIESGFRSLPVTLKQNREKKRAKVIPTPDAFHVVSESTIIFDALHEKVVAIFFKNAIKAETLQLMQEQLKKLWANPKLKIGVKGALKRKELTFGIHNVPFQVQKGTCLSGPSIAHKDCYDQIINLIPSITSLLKNSETHAQALASTKNLRVGGVELDKESPFATITLRMEADHPKPQTLANWHPFSAILPISFNQDPTKKSSAVAFQMFECIARENTGTSIRMESGDLLYADVSLWHQIKAEGEMNNLATLFFYTAPNLAVRAVVPGTETKGSIFSGEGTGLRMPKRLIRSVGRAGSPSEEFSPKRTAAASPPPLHSPAGFSLGSSSSAFSSSSSSSARAPDEDPLSAWLKELDLSGKSIAHDLQDQENDMLHSCLAGPQSDSFGASAHKKQKV